MIPGTAADSRTQVGFATFGPVHLLQLLGQMTVGGELNKLAGNISLFRNAAGVHWRTDYTESLLLGERVAIQFLREVSLTFNEDGAFFQLNRFDGSPIRILEGRVEPVA